MSGETEQDVSGWTTDTLHELVLSRLASARDHTDGRFAANRDYIDGKVEALRQRLADIDRATEVLSATVTNVPTDLQKVAADLLRLMDERDRRIVGDITGLSLRVEARFDANEKLSQTESGLNQTALAAALAAQEKAAAVQVDTFSSLIRGLGERIDRTIDKNAELASVSANALGARVTQLGEQMNELAKQVAQVIQARATVQEQRVDTRGGIGTIGLIIGTAIGLAGFLFALLR